MARIGRFVVPDLPHHVTQRGNRRERVFFGDDDYALYRDLLHEACAREGVAVWSYCLMPNHVHLILTPSTPEGLGRALGKAHRRYSAFINARMRVTGHLFQARFASVVMDETHLMAAARYVALNPVRARLVARAQDWRWSSARAHLAGRDDELVTVEPLLERCAGRFADLLDHEPEPATAAALRAAETIGRPLGSPEFSTGSPRERAAIPGRAGEGAGSGPTRDGEAPYIREICLCHRLPRVAARTGRDPRPGRRGRRKRADA
jgi:putative transposase